jgi:hypothetical protein
LEGSEGAGGGAVVRKPQRVFAPKIVAEVLLPEVAIWNNVATTGLSVSSILEIEHD